jgi:hypothetical protein
MVVRVVFFHLALKRWREKSAGKAVLFVIKTLISRRESFTSKNVNIIVSEVDSSFTGTSKL